MGGRLSDPEDLYGNALTNYLRNKRSFTFLFERRSDANRTLNCFWLLCICVIKKIWFTMFERTIIVLLFKCLYRAFPYNYYMKAWRLNLIQIDLTYLCFTYTFWCTWRSLLVCFSSMRQPISWKKYTWILAQGRIVNHLVWWVYARTYGHTHAFIYLTPYYTRYKNANICRFLIE